MTRPAPCSLCPYPQLPRQPRYFPRRHRFSPASQSASRTRNNNAYSYDPGSGSGAGGQSPGTTNYTPNGLNQYSTIDPPPSTGSGQTGSVAPQYDARGNLTDNGSDSYEYDALNRLTQATVDGTTTQYEYDPLGRLYEIQIVGAFARRYLWDSDRIIARYFTNGTIFERYVHMPGSLGAPVTVLNRDGVAAADRSYVQTDERGSVISMTNGATGAQTVPHTYGPYGEPGAGNNQNVAFGYAGQLDTRNNWL